MGTKLHWRNIMMICAFPTCSPASAGTYPARVNGSMGHLIVLVFLPKIPSVRGMTANLDTGLGTIIYSNKKFWEKHSIWRAAIFHKWIGEELRSSHPLFSRWISLAAHHAYTDNLNWYSIVHKLGLGCPCFWPWGNPFERSGWSREGTA